MARTGAGKPLPRCLRSGCDWCLWCGQYSGAGQGKPLPMVLVTRTGAIDRGACIKDLSQYPGEVGLP